MDQQLKRRQTSEDEQECHGSSDNEHEAVREAAPCKGKLRK